MGIISIICAIRQETVPILKRFPAERISWPDGLPAWTFQAYGHSVTLIECGIGSSKAAKAAETAAALGLDIIISAGFCGSLTKGVAIGELFLAEKLYSYSAGTFSAGIIPEQELNGLIGTRLKKATFITTAEIVNKAQVHSLLPDPAAATMLEMESSAVAAVCRSSNIRFFAIRSVSDTAEQDPSKLFQLICDNKCNVSRAKAVLSLIRKPSLMPEFLQLYRNSTVAGKTLTEAIALALESI